VGLGRYSCRGARHVVAWRTRYCFTTRLMRTNQSSVYCLPPPALPTLLHDYFTTIAQYTIPLRPASCMPYTIQYWSWQYRVKAKSSPRHRFGLTRIQHKYGVVYYCVYVYVCICVYVYIYICIHIYIYIYISVAACRPQPVRPAEKVFFMICIYIYMHICLCV